MPKMPIMRINQLYQQAESSYHFILHGADVNMTHEPPHKVNGQHIAAAAQQHILLTATYSRGLYFLPIVASLID